MATRNSKTKKAKLQGWGIAQLNLDGSMDLVSFAYNRIDNRETKREVYPGSDYKVVRINATLETYTK